MNLSQMAALLRAVFWSTPALSLTSCSRLSDYILEEKKCI